MAEAHCYYRLGDIFNYVHRPNTNHKHRRPWPTLQLIVKTLELYENSIGSEYIKQAHHWKDYKTLNNIMLQYISKNDIDLPTPEEWVIHIRTGDVIDNISTRVEDIWNNPLKLQDRWDLEGNEREKIKRRPHHRAYYQKKLNKSKKYNIKNITICTNHHRAISNEKSNLYLTKVHDLLGSRYPVTTRDNQPADLDFVFMCNSNYFTRSRGSFSKIIEKQILLNGGILI